jgi:uncharacterized coiled-coil protein SlyX
VSAAFVGSSVVSEVSGPITELTQQLGSLQVQVALLQHQLALLTEQLQKVQQGSSSVIKTSKNNALESSLDTSVPASIDRRKHPHRCESMSGNVIEGYDIVDVSRSDMVMELTSPVR